MTVKSWPNLKVASFRWKKSERAAVFASMFGSQALSGGAPVWEVEMTGVPQYWAEAIAANTFFESLEGYANQIELWNLVQPVPAGTMRGTMTLSGAVAQGASTLVITAGLGQAGATLLAGDLLGLGSGTTQQVVRVTANAAANGSGEIAVPIGAGLRNAFASGSAVTWSQPKVLFRQKSLTDGIEFAPVIGQPWTLSLVEDWRA